MDDQTIDRIFCGSLGTLPPVSSKIVRIFTSSTFTDTSMERNTLMAEVYPKLKEYCREKHGLEFQVVDMRWGVRDEATDDHMTTELCMKEIDNCQRLSMGPNFVVFLGQKYGYRPIPTYILSSELALLREMLVSLGSDVTLLDMWYKKDTNAVPPISILQPISSILVNFNNKRVPKLQQQDQAIWWDTLEKMQKLFRKASQTLNQQGRLSHDAMHNYFMSVTEREVIRGILNVRNTKNHCLAYIRIINNINLQNLRRAGLFIDIANRAVDAEAVRLLANLRDERLTNKIEPSNFQKYTVDWIGRDGLATDTHEEYLQHFIQHFYRNIARLVDRAMRKEDSSPQGQIITEILQHLHACNNAVKVFVGREPDLDKVKQYITGPCNQPLVLYGSGGCGKTSLLAKSGSLVNQWLAAGSNNPHSVENREENSRSSLSSSSRQESVASNATHVHAGDTSSGFSSARMSQQSQDLPDDTFPIPEAANPHEVSEQDSHDSVKAILITRFLGTTPDSSALTPMLLSICQQISYNYLLPFEAIPDDLVPLTAYMKQLLNCATKEQPLLLFLDSVDQIGGAQDANKMAWLPMKLPPHCKIVVSCVNELDNPEISRDYQLLRRMIDTEENFVEISALGEDLALQVIRQWMRNAHRDLTNYQWRVVSNALGRCSLPIFVKLVFAEINRWKSYSRAQETHLASNVMDSIMMLFERIEIQHGRILVFHALAYITASRSGLSESELEDLLSLDDRVLDDVYQYHMPPVRRIPPLLWTRIRNDLPNYLSEREADGVSVLNWYHRQFKEAAKERYFKNVNMAIYFHSSIAEYFLGTWGGGTPKPFKFTEIQRMRFNLTEKEGEADRKVPLQPLVFHGKDGSVSRYNLRKFGELPYHLIRARRFDDLYNHVLFNYQWLHAKLSSSPLQAVLSDFEDACNNLEDRDVSREIMLVADALRLGGAILGQYPDMLAPQLIGRLLPEAPSHVHVKQLLEQCDKEGAQHCALLPAAHCMHTPGGPLKYSLEGHQFAVFGFCLTSDYRYVVSVSNRFLTWDLSTSDLTRAVNPGIEGVFQGLVLSPDNRFAAAWTNNGQTAILNLLTSELALLSNPFKEDLVKGAFLLDTHCFVWGAQEWALVTLQGQVLQINSKVGPTEMHLLSMNFTSLEDYSIILWSGQLENKKLQFYAVQGKRTSLALDLYSVLVMNQKRNMLYASTELKAANVSLFHLDSKNNANECAKWVRESGLEGSEALLQLKLSEDEDFLLGTTALGFEVWNLAEGPDCKRLDFKLPAGVRNISVKLLTSNSIVMSKDAEYAIAGVRKNLYVWNTKNSQLVKTLDAHFGRILALAPFTAGPWNSVITSSIDRTVKVWNINHIFEQVHVIDRHELQIDSICVCQKASLVVTVTRGCVGVWQLQTGKLIDRLADSALGAIVTHAVITRDGKYIVSAESGNVLIWERATRKVVFKAMQPSVKQIKLIDTDEVIDTTVREQRFLAVSRLGTTAEGRAVLVMRELPSGIAVYEVECPVRSFRPAVFTGDGLLLVVVGVERNRDTLFVFQAATGLLVHKFCPRRQVSKECLALKVLPGKAAHVALMDQDKGVVFDVRSRRHVRTIRRWTGPTTQDGRYALYAPSRGGLELIELKHGTTVFSLIPRIAEGMFSNIALFDNTDQYVMYYHSGRRTIRLFRVRDGAQLADYRLPAELSSICSTDDGRSLVIGTVDGCLAVLCIVDPSVSEPTGYLMSLPSRLMLKGTDHSNLQLHNASDHHGEGTGHGNRPPLSFRTAATVAAAWAQANALSRPASARIASNGTEKNSQACAIS